MVDRGDAKGYVYGSRPEVRYAFPCFASPKAILDTNSGN